MNSNSNQGPSEDVAPGKASTAREAMRSALSEIDPASADAYSDEQIDQLVAATLPQDAPKAGEWIERWHGSGAERGWAIYERHHGERIAYIGEGDHSERLTSIIVAAHNAAFTNGAADTEFQAAANLYGDMLADFQAATGCMTAAEFVEKQASTARLT